MTHHMLGATRPSFARTAFDGSSWVSDLELKDGDGSTVAFAMPGLIDAHCRVWGELAYPLAGEPFEPIDKCRSLMVAAGIVAYRDVGNSLGSRSFLESTASTTRTPDMRVCGPTIDCLPAQHANTRIVSTVDDVFREIDRLVGDEVTGVSTGAFLTAELVEAAVKAADRHALPVVHLPGTVSAIEACELGVSSLSYLPKCLPLEGDRAADKVLSAASLDVDEAVATLASALLASDTTLVPLLHSCRRSSVLEEIVNEPRLDELVEIAPFHSYLRDLRGTAAMTFGKKYAKRYLGLAPMRASVKSQFDQGWQRLLDVLAGLDRAGVCLLPGSDATGLSVVPGFALHDELATWSTAGIESHRVLGAATSRAAARLGISKAGSLLDSQAVLVSTTEMSPTTPIPEILRSIGVHYAN